MKEEQSPRFENVMIIDDSVMDLYISSRMITKHNFGEKVLQYSSATEALEYLQESQENISQLPEVIFVDIYMPGMSGFEFMKEYDKLTTSFKNYCSVFIVSSSIDQRDLICANEDKNVVAMQGKPITKEFLKDLKTS